MNHKALLAAVLGVSSLVAIAACSSRVSVARVAETAPLLTGQAALGDWTTDAPGVRRKLTPADLPPPGDTPSVDRGPKMVPRPEGAWPKAPAGFVVEKFAENIGGVRAIRTAPNGDLFAVDSFGGKLMVFRDADSDGKPEVAQTFATGLDRAFGIAFWPGKNPRYIYIGNTASVVRFPYKSGDLSASGPAETVVNNLPGGGRLRGGGHWTRAVAFSKDEKTMYVSVGSLTNNDDPEENRLEERRACVLAFTPDGQSERLFASGIRNAVGLATHPSTGALWCSVNERDGLGDMLVPDYVTSIKEGGFYGWPYYYIGGNYDPRHQGKHPELREKVLVPDVLLQSHSASLDLCFSTGRQFPRAWRGGIFAAEHGSWNRASRTGYKVVYIPLDRRGRATGEYVDFLTGFVKSMDEVWGRPVGVTVARDGSLLVCDDGSRTIWRVRYDPKAR